MNTREDPPNYDIRKWKYNWNNNFKQYRKYLWEIEIYGSVNKLYMISLFQESQCQEHKEKLFKCWWQFHNAFSVAVSFKSISSATVVSRRENAIKIKHKPNKNSLNTRDIIVLFHLLVANIFFCQASKDFVCKLISCRSQLIGKKFNIEVS